MTLPLVVCFHTDDRFYSAEVENLRASLHKFDMDHRIVTVPSEPSWTGNCARKGPFIWKQLIELRQNLLWLDADAVVIERPDIFEDMGERADFAAYWHKDRELISATMFFAYNERTLQLVDNWQQACLLFPHVWDQKLLQQCVGQMGSRLRQERLPFGYCHIFNRSYDGQVFIQQNQASRRFKKNINAGLK